MRIKETKVYQFDELSDRAKEEVISDHINFMLEVIQYEDASDNFKKAIDKAEAMQTPWFTGSYIYEYCKDEVIENIKINEYEFTEDGKLA